MFGVSFFFWGGQPDFTHHTKLKGNVPWSSYAAVCVGAVWRLVYSQATGEDVHAPEEVVASLQGIICSSDLPPFRERIT